VLVLAIDTSTAATTAELVEVDDTSVQSRAVRQVVDARGHGEHLAPLIEAALAEAMITPGDLSALVVGIGPGPFTGLRVGLVTAAVMADTLGVPVYGLCSLDGLVAPERSGRVLAATDARRREVYWATYVDGTRARGPEVAAPADVPTADLDETTGAGAELYTDVLGLPYDGGRYPSGLTLVSRAIDRIRAAAPSDPLTPLYLRRPDAVPPGAPKPVTA
jgi:tRNA threonylcarbamoyl adenosine modification protein YeaZ